MICIQYIIMYVCSWHMYQWYVNSWHACICSWHVHTFMIYTYSWYMCILGTCVWVLMMYVCSWHICVHDICMFSWYVCSQYMCLWYVCSWSMCEYMPTIARVWKSVFSFIFLGFRGPNSVFQLWVILPFEPSYPYLIFSLIYD